jgi:hypothetical protein
VSDPKKPDDEPGNDLPPAAGEIDTGWDAPGEPLADPYADPYSPPESGEPAATYADPSQPVQPQYGYPPESVDPKYGYGPASDPVEPHAHGYGPSDPDAAPILPAAEPDLQASVAATPAPGAPPGEPPQKKRRRMRDLDDDEPKPSGGKTLIIVALSIIFGLSIATFALLGRANATRYLITCSSDKIVAEQGRIFPPWGSRPMGGDEWKPIAIPPNAECKPRETDDQEELAKWYLVELVDQASTQLTAREVTKVDVAAEQLNQALLLARTPDRREQRKDIERLLGDVEYWRASAKLRDAATSLADAAKQFDAAAQQRPRHVSDASAWASYIRKLVDELRAGPSGGAPSINPSQTSPERPSSPPGTALPVEGSGSNEAPAIQAPDAGVPTGGVLL